MYFILARFSCVAAIILGAAASGSSLDSLLRRDIVSGCSSSSGSLSCHNTSVVSNLCCFESPGGLLLQTQFWDTNPPTGPADSWTIHGLWPDNCDGTFGQDPCDPSRAYTDIPSLLTSQGASDTLSFIQKFWKNINGDDEGLWEHEWSKHGTCMSTLRTNCLPSGSPRGAEAVAYIQTIVRLFKSLPTYTWLASQGIMPSSTETYTLSQLTTALTTASGGIKPALQCSGSSLNSISWYFNLQGSIIDGNFVPIASPSSSTCPSTGIRYPLKSSVTTTTTTKTTATSTATQTDTTGSTALPGRARIQSIVSSSGSTVGGLLTLGTWSTQTLATYTLSGILSNFTLSSSKGNCGVQGETFSCGSTVASTNFSAVASGGRILLASEGETTFSSDGVPSGTTVFPVFVGNGHSQKYTLSIVSA